MTNKKPCWFMLDMELADRLEGMKARTGISTAEQIRRAIRYWLESQEWPVTKRPRARANMID
jgi:hypothetical protein